MRVVGPPTSSTTSANAASAITTSGRVSPNAWRSSDAFQVGLGSTTAAPARLAPCWAISHSGRLLTTSAIRAPGPTPRRVNAWANEFPVLSSSRYM